MENKNASSKKNVGGILLDIFTIGMLFASFAALFYSGFILKTDTFPLGALCAITMVGLLLLFFIGTISCLSSKAKNKTLSVGFLVFAAIQLVALIANLALLLGIMVNLFSVEGLFARLTYIISVSIILVGYVSSISYFSDGNVGELSDEKETEDEDETEDDDEVAVDEESDEDEESDADQASDADEEFVIYEDVIAEETDPAADELSETEELFDAEEEENDETEVIEHD